MSVRAGYMWKYTIHVPVILNLILLLNSYGWSFQAACSAFLIKRYYQKLCRVERAINSLNAYNYIGLHLICTFLSMALVQIHTKFKCLLKTRALSGVTVYCILVILLL